jgi:hypothetical protein
MIKRKPLSEETKKKISESLKGHSCYKNAQRGVNISKANKGRTGFNKGKFGILSPMFGKKQK